MADSKKATGGKRFSVYAGLGDSPEISWSTVASTLSEDLTSMRETKMKERAAIEKATNEQMEALNKLQDVNSRSLGRVVLEGSSQSKEELRLRMDLVRKGLLKPADYKLFMQEQKSGYSNFSNIVKTYDQWHTKAMEKINAGTATDAEIFVLKQIESFGNLNNKKIYTNPANGQIQVVTMEKDADGKYTKMPSAKDNPNSFSNPGRMLDLMSYDGGVKKELRDEVKKITDSIATIITSSVSNGSVTKTSDFRQIFDDPESLKDFGITDEDITTFDQWLDSQVKTVTATDADMAQILSQRGYQYDDKDAPNYIELYIKGGQVVYKLTDDQKAKARQIAKNEINLQIDSEITKTPGFDQNSSGALKKVNEEQDKASTVKLYNDIMSDPANNLDKLNEDNKFSTVESVEMVDKNGKVTENKDEAISMRVVKIEGGEQVTTNVQLRKEINGSRIDTRKFITDSEGKSIPNPNYEKPNAQVSNELILKGYLGNLGIPSEEIEMYMKAYKKQGGKINDFLPKNYRRESVKIVDTSTKQIDRKNGKEGNAGLIITEVLENKEEDSPFKAFEAAANAEGATDAAKKEFKQYKVNMISSYINDAFGTSLRGKPFNIQLNEDDSITVKFNNKDIILPKTLSGYGTQGQLLISDIENILNLDRLPEGTCVNGKVKMAGGVIADC